MRCSRCKRTITIGEWMHNPNFRIYEEPEGSPKSIPTDEICCTDCFLEDFKDN